ncbi:MAG: hypothetical protein ACXAD7_19345 [Candidatus Kariarchaeaceae archaeon]|jgi:hypothetical protein
MLYKLYKNNFRQKPPAERRQLFADLYKQNEVELLGVWKNKDDPLEYYMLTRYRDENHYKEFVETVKKIPEYQEMTKRISEVRLSSEVIDLVEE